MVRIGQKFLINGDVWKVFAKDKDGGVNMINKKNETLTAMDYELTGKKKKLPIIQGLSGVDMDAGAWK